MPGIRVPWAFSVPKGRARFVPFIPLPPGNQARGELLGGESPMGGRAHQLLGPSLGG